MQKPFYSADEAFSGIVPTRHVDYFLKQVDAIAWQAVHGGVITYIPDDHRVASVGMYRVRREIPGHAKRLQVVHAIGDQAKEAALVEETGAADFNDLFRRG